MTVRAKPALIVGMVLAFLAFAKLEPITAGIAVLFIIAGGFVVFSPSLRARTKVAAVLTGLAIILASNQIELWQKARDQRRQEEVIRQQSEAEAERKRKLEEAFTKLSPAEHLAKAKALIKLGAPQNSIAEGFHHISAIKPQAPEYKLALRLREQYETEKKRYDRQQEAIRAVAAKKQAAKDAKVLEIARGRYPAEAEKAALDEGHDMNFRTYGPQKTILEIRYALMDRVFAYQFMKSESSVANIESMGFKKIVFVNSITGDSWSYAFGK